MKRTTTGIVMAGADLAGTAEAENVRVSARGDSLEVVGKPADVAALPLCPLCAMGGGIVVASHGGRLYSLRNGSVTMIADMGEGCEIHCGIGGGNKAIVMTSAGALHIVAYGGEAVCLGTMPELPPVNVELEVCAMLSETVANLVLADPDSLRNGALSGRDAAALTSALDAAWQRILTRAAAIGASVIPEGVTVTAEVRRLDPGNKAVGSSGRRAVGPGVSPPEVTMPVSGDSIGPFVLTVPVVKARITMETMDAETMATWGEGSVKAQIALSAAPLVAATWTMRVERPASGNPQLTVITHLEAVSSGADELLQSVAVVPAGTASELSVSVPERITEPVGEVVAGEMFIARTGAVSGDVVMWGGIIGAEGDVAVAPASSPLAIESRSTVSLSAVSVLVPVPRLGSVALSPGCAHFYAFTADGILNVSVGSRRGAPAASLLDCRGVSGKSSVAVMDGWVAALTDAGNELIRLRGGSASTLYRSTRIKFIAVAPEPISGELYLLSGGGEVLAFDVSRQWFTKRGVPYAVESMAAVGQSLYLTSAGGFSNASSPDGSTAVAVEWRASLPASVPVGAKLIMVGLQSPTGFAGRIRVWTAGFPETDFGATSPAWQALISGSPRSPLVFRLPLPVRACAVVEISGTAAPGTRLTGIAVATAIPQSHGR
ncbi:MAG: hypothetical protein HDR92_05765 [Bacteroides sp.]|nr:hypothetical protein [Bacteroides sp.]